MLTVDRKICLPSTEKTPYRMMVKSSYRAQELTEILRAGSLEGTEELMERIRPAYAALIEALKDSEDVLLR